MASPAQINAILNRLTALDGITSPIPSAAAVPTIEADLNGIHTTISQVTLTIQAQLNEVTQQVATLQATVNEIAGGIPGIVPITTPGITGEALVSYDATTGHFAQAAFGGGGGAVSSVFGRTNAVTAQDSDYSSFYLDLAGGTLTGGLIVTNPSGVGVTVNGDSNGDYMLSLVPFSSDATGQFTIADNFDGSAYIYISTNSFTYTASIDASGFSFYGPGVSSSLSPGQLIVSGDSGAVFDVYNGGTVVAFHGGTGAANITEWYANGVSGAAPLYVDPTGVLNATNGLKTSSGVELVGTITKYDNIVTVGKGVPSQIAAVDLATQSADIPGTSLYNVTTGMYRVSAYIVLTTVDGVSSTLPSVQIQWADPDTNTAVGWLALTPTNSGDVFNTILQWSAVIHAKGGGGLSYNTTGYASNSPNAMKFALHIRLEAL